MKKYFTIFKSELMSTLQYIFNIFFKLINYVFMIFILINLWDYIYSNPEEIINGYSKIQMIWYVIITELIVCSADTRKYCRKIVDDVKCGNIAYMINKPYSYIGFVISRYLGETLVKVIVSGFVGISIGYIFLKGFPVLTFPAILIVILSAILAILINAILVTFIGLVSFFIEDSNPLYWLYSKLILVLGVLFPVEYFPDAISKVIKFSPIYVICYGPAKLFVNFSYSSAIKILIVQIIYVFFSWAICYALYRKGVRKLNVTGG